MVGDNAISVGTSECCISILMRLPSGGATSGSGRKVNVSLKLGSFTAISGNGACGGVGGSTGLGGLRGRLVQRREDLSQGCRGSRGKRSARETGVRGRGLGMRGLRREVSGVHASCVGGAVTRVIGAGPSCVAVRSLGMGNVVGGERLSGTITSRGFCRFEVGLRTGYGRGKVRLHMTSE